MGARVLLVWSLCKTETAWKSEGKGEGVHGGSVMCV